MDVVCTTCRKDIDPKNVLDGPNYCSEECEPECMRRLRTTIRQLNERLEVFETLHKERTYTGPTQANSKSMYQNTSVNLADK